MQNKPVTYDLPICQSRKGHDLVFFYFANTLGRDLSDRAEYISGREAIDLLAFLDDHFLPAIKRIKAVPYDERHALAADALVWGLANDPSAPPAPDEPVPVMRVVFQRYIYVVALACAREKLGTYLTVFPSGLTREQKRAALLLGHLTDTMIPDPLPFTYTYEDVDGKAQVSITLVPEALT